MADAADDDLRKSLRDFRASVSEEFASIDDRFRQVDERFDRLEGRMDRLDGRMADLADEVRTRTVTMETAILNAIRELRGEMLRTFADHDRRLRRLEE